MMNTWKRSPFSRTDKDKKYKIPIGSGQKGQTLSKDELIAFINAGKISGERIAENPMYRAKQLFLFSFFGQGCNFKDLALLRYESIRGNHIEFERQKTIRTKKGHSKIQIPLTDDLKAILVEQVMQINTPQNMSSMFSIRTPVTLKSKRMTKSASG